MRILLIDDDKACLESLSNALSLNGFPNIGFTDPKKAIEAFKTRNFEVVVTDQQMPDMNGTEVLKTVRTLNPSTQVIIVTGFMHFFDHTSETENQKAYAFFRKPIDIESLLATFEKIKEDLNFTPQI